MTQQQDDPYGLENSLNELLDLAYRGGFVPVDYEVVYQSIGKDDIALRKASKKELNLSDHQLVSILGYQFRDDHFDNGSWIRTHVAKKGCAVTIAMNWLGAGAAL
ncbi:MAG: hypothetical protein ACLTSX_06495 [Collinsella sp.]